MALQIVPLQVEHMRKRAAESGCHKLPIEATARHVFYKKERKERSSKKKAEATDLLEPAKERPARCTTLTLTQP